VSSLELSSVTIQARLGSARLLYKLDSARLGYCTSSARARLSSTRLGSFTGLATGNTILGDKKAFDSKKSSTGVTGNCELQRTVLSDGQIISVIDIPGMYVNFSCIQ
jgi:hypothetical protein